MKQLTTGFIIGLIIGVFAGYYWAWTALTQVHEDLQEQKAIYQIAEVIR